MEITEHKASKLEELSKDIKYLDDKDLDKSLGRRLKRFLLLVVKKQKEI